MRVFLDACGSRERAKEYPSIEHRRSPLDDPPVDIREQERDRAPLEGSDPTPGAYDPRLTHRAADVSAREGYWGGGCSLADVAVFAAVGVASQADDSAWWMSRSIIAAAAKRRGWRPAVSILPTCGREEYLRDSTPSSREASSACTSHVPQRRCCGSR